MVVKNLLTQRRARGGFRRRYLLRNLADLFPQFVASGAGLGGVGKRASGGILLSESAQSIVKLIVGEPVALGGDEQEVAVGGAEEVQQLAVTLLGRDVGVDQNDAEAQRGAFVEVGFDELRPFLGNLAGNLGVAVAGEVGKNQLGLRLSRPAYFEEVNAAGAAWSGTGARHFVADQGVNHARFADIGAAEESDLRQAGGGEVRGVGGRRQESGENPHAQVCNGGEWIGKRGRGRVQSSTRDPSPG